jgi:hypothetical protein
LKIKRGSIVTKVTSKIRREGNGLVFTEIAEIIVTIKLSSKQLKFGKFGNNAGL